MLRRRHCGPTAANADRPRTRLCGGGGSIDDGGPAGHVHGPIHFIFTDANGEATVSVPRAIGLRKLNHGISWTGFSAGHILGLQEWRESEALEGNDTRRMPGSSKTKIVLMGRTHDAPMRTGLIHSFSYHEIETGEAEVTPGQEEAFCEFVDSLRESGRFALEEISVGSNESPFAESEVFAAHLAECSAHRPGDGRASAVDR